MNAKLAASWLGMYDLYDGTFVPYHEILGSTVTAWVCSLSDIVVEPVGRI
jgi:hypothetical protein